MWEFYPSFSQSKNQLMDVFQSYEQQWCVVCRSNSLCANAISPKGNIRSEIDIYAPTLFIWKGETASKMMKITFSIKIWSPTASKKT